ncbi:MAG: DUF4065 domain-containing protein [Leptospiraceae bacterium]|nr:DUF4065 domain-containing protein [Leptospiraceae bacterium]
MYKLKQVIYYILLKSGQKRTRSDLAKLVYYSDTVFFQRHSSTISKERYIHLEDCPQAFSFVGAIAEMNEEGLIDIGLDIIPGRMPGFLFSIKNTEYEIELEKEERRIIQKVLKAFPESVVDENRHYPNLYETYVVTPVFSEIKITKDTINTKIHFHKKKSLLSFSGKIFRVFYEE